MKLTKKLFGPLTCLFFLGALLTLLMTILTGSVTKSIYKHFYWLETDCSGFGGADIDGLCRWTNYGICQVSNGDNTLCTPNSAAYPLDPARNFGSGEGLPGPFRTHNKYYYYTSRIGYGFQLAGVGLLFLAFLAFFGLWFMEKTVAKAIFYPLLALATVFIIPGAALTTTAYVKGRNIFRDAGLHTAMGSRSMALLWTTVALLLLIWLFSALMGGSSRNFKLRATRPDGWYKRKDIPPQDQMVAVGGTGATTVTTATYNEQNPHVMGSSFDPLTTPPPRHEKIQSLAPPARDLIV